MLHPNVVRSESAHGPARDHMRLALRTDPEVLLDKPQQILGDVVFPSTLPTVDVPASLVPRLQRARDTAVGRDGDHWGHCPRDDRLIQLSHYLANELPLIPAEPMEP